MAALSIMYKVGMEVSELNKGVEQVNSKLDSIGTLAGEVGKGLLSAFTATALIGGIQQLISASLEYADVLSNLHDRTGVSIQGLQQMEAIGRTAGVSMENMANAVLMLQKNLGKDAGIDAIAEMGLNFGKIRALAPEEQFMTIAKRLAEIDDPIKRANLGSALFGRKWAEVAGAFEQDVDSILENTHRMSDEQVEGLDEAGDAWDTWAGNVMSSAKSLVGSVVLGIQWLDKLRHSFDFLRDSAMRIPKLPEPPAPRVGAGPKKVLEDWNELERVVKEQNKKIEDSIKAREKVEREAAAAAEKHAEKVAAGLERMRYGHFKLGEAVLATAKNTSPLNMRFSETVAISTDYSKKLMEAQIKTDAFGHVIATNVVPSLGDMGRGVIDTKVKVETLTEKLQKFPSILVKAFTGGGNLKGAINALGADIGSSLFSEGGAFFGATKAAKAGLTKVFGSTVGEAFGAAIPGIGALIGPAFEKLAGWIGSLFGNKTKDAIVGSFGSYDALRQKLNELGAEGERMWIRLTQQTGRNDLKSAQAQIEEITEALAFQDQAMKTLEETAKKYGLTIEELGPAWQKQELDKKARELFKDYQILIAAGVDHKVVLDKMAKSANEYVNNAVRMGHEVPEAMRPMLEAMVQNGQLLDANGNKVDDLEKAGIKFSMSMSDGFRALISEVQKLTDVIAKSLGVSIDTVRKKSDVANEAMQDGFNDSAKAAEKLADAVDSVSYGSSPGGLKDIIAMAPRAAQAMASFSKDAGKDLGKIVTIITTIGRGLGGIKPPPGWKGEARDTYIDIARELAILKAPTELAKDKLRLQFDKEDEIAAIRATKGLTAAQVATLIGMVNEKYAILLAQLLQEHAEKNAVSMAAGGMGMVDRPTLFRAGEAGPEEFAFSGANRRFGRTDKQSNKDVVMAVNQLKRDLLRALRDQVRSNAIAVHDAMVMAR